MDAERSEIAERVQPDPETVEDVLNELVQAGI
jgi:DNA-binding IscR family transcriptional regulator